MIATVRKPQSVHQYDLELAPLSPTLPQPAVIPSRTNDPVMAIFCLWPSALRPGQPVRLSLADVSRELSAETRVLDCLRSDRDYQLTLAFVDQDQAFRFRMAEQLSQIQFYWQRSMAQGRTLSFNQAALEWINECGGSFTSAAITL